MEVGDLRLVKPLRQASFTWGRSSCLKVPEDGTAEVQRLGPATTPKPKQPHMPYMSEDSAELRPRLQGKHFIQTSDHDEIPLCKVL
jgi:hypothetical protein